MRKYRARWRSKGDDGEVKGTVRKYRARTEVQGTEKKYRAR